MELDGVEILHKEGNMLKRKIIDGVCIYLNLGKAMNWIGKNQVDIVGFTYADVLNRLKA